jgi:cation transport ATPase
MSTLTFEVSGMSCGSCVGRVSKAFADWADQAEVTLNPPRLKLTNPKTRDLSQLAAVAAQAGKYKISPAAGTAANTLPPLAELMSRSEPIVLPGKNAMTDQPQAPKTQRDAALESLSQAGQSSVLQTYRPLLLVMAFVLGASLIAPLRQGSFQMHAWMHDFMGIWFVAFAFFKLLDLPKFAMSFARYDPLAAALPAYGKAYPFIELALGIAFLMYWNMVIASTATVVVLGITTIGVLRAIARKQVLQCACLGTGFALPVGWATVVENVLMMVMSAWMILHVSMMG